MRPFKAHAPQPTPLAAMPEAPELRVLTLRGQTLEFQLAHTADVEMQICNVLGQEVRCIHGGRFGPGSHVLRWNGLDRNGRKAPPGMYFYVVHADDVRAAAKGALLR